MYYDLCIVVFRSDDNAESLQVHTRGARTPFEIKKLYVPLRSRAVKRRLQTPRRLIRPPLWALTIGINDYTYPTEKWGKLKGAVPDANAMEEYLRKYLKVPSNQIINLRDKEATRENIIDAFHSLRLNTGIRYHDPILIYYAGHGGEVNLGEEVIQFLVPVDYCAGKTSPIPDRAIAALINGIADAHGNNIVSCQLQLTVLQC